jgi:hypothetical protein
MRSCATLTLFSSFLFVVDVGECSSFTAITGSHTMRGTSNDVEGVATAVCRHDVALGLLPLRGGHGERYEFVALTLLLTRLRSTDLRTLTSCCAL